MPHHLLYVGAIGTCVVMHSRFFNGWQGHLLKSRARVNRILWNELVDSPEGAASYELEFPNGGDNLVQGSRIEQSARTQNATMPSMGAEADGRRGVGQRVRSHVASGSGFGVRSRVFTSR